MNKHLFVYFFLLVNFVLAQNFEFVINPVDYSSNRKVLLLNRNWTYEFDDEVKKVNVPFWIDKERIELKNKFKLNGTGSSIYYLRFEGIRGLEEVYFNDERISFDPIGVEEFSFKLPSNLVRENGENYIRLIISNRSRIKHHNVLASKLELPERKFGAYKDIYLEILPRFSITEVNLSSELDNNLLNGKINFSYEISTHKQISTDSSLKLSMIIEVLDGKSSAIINSFKEEIYFHGNLISRRNSILIKNPILWDINNPHHYVARFKLYRDENLIDQFSSHISFRKIEILGSKLLLNKKPIVLRGVTYLESNGVNNSFFKLHDYERDIRIIKDLNANAIFIKNSYPSDELIYECEKNGILVFIDLDSKIYPPKLSNQQLLEKREKLKFIIDKYSNSGCFIGLNFGLINNLEALSWLNPLEEIITQSGLNILKFIETEQTEWKSFEKIDFVAYNLLHKSIDDIEKFVFKLDDERFILISSLGYNHGIDEEDGYSNPHSTQAQAKFLSEAFKVLIEKNVSFFVHTFSDYRLPYHSIIAGKLDNKLMKYGLVNEYRDKSKFSFQVFKSYITDSKLPIIMQGNYTEKANIVYVISGLLLLALTIITINSTHRFRENVSRAVLKTYNFFSDIRDGWFISSFHSLILALTIALSNGLTYSGLFHYWKDKIEFEKFTSLFNSGLFFEFFSYVAWRPIESITYFTLITIGWMLLLTLIIRFFNLFVRNKIFFNHAFLIVVWSAIPFIILIPLGMIAFKILSLDEYNLLIYIVIIIFHAWVITRTLKGVAIVFETKKSKVYLLSFLFFVIVLASLVLYLQFNFSSIDYFMEYFG